MKKYIIWLLIGIALWFIGTMPLFHAECGFDFCQLTNYGILGIILRVLSFIIVAVVILVGVFKPLLDKIRIGLYSIANKAKNNYKDNQNK